jgi:hypothetical protein
MFHKKKILLFYATVVVLKLQYSVILERFRYLFLRKNSSFEDHLDANLLFPVPV